MAPLSVHNAGGGRNEGGADFEGDAVQNFADGLVRCHAAGADQRRGRADTVAKYPQPYAQTVHDHVADRLLKRRAEIGDVLIAQGRDFLRFQAQRGLQTRQREISVVASSHGAGQREALRVAVRRLFFDLRPARKAETKQFGGLVESLADRVVDGAAEPHVVADAEHAEDLGMAAGGEEQAIGKRRRVGEPRRQRMRFQVVDRDQRLVGAPARWPSPWSGRR